MIAAPCDAVKRAVRDPFPATPARSLPVATAILLVASAVYLGMLLGEIPGLALDRTAVAGWLWLRAAR
jgi:hypothetical protein